ncbi:ribosomal RNA processing protein 36 homolog isoform X2 [Planococcus citri]|uniref:ribosomal RNA processing protein 36 homolog isoform X2 n=1 Tax=Planococcus citri TaxID=170843 RepID=UPI0031F854FC
MTDSEPTDVETEGEEDIRMPDELSNVPFQDLDKYTDKFNVKRRKIKSKKSESQSQFHRENKNRPTEVSSKRPKQHLAPIPKARPSEPKPRDPRFDHRTGTFDEQHFQKNYKFISKIKKKEQKMLSQKLQDPETDSNDREKIKLLLQRQKNQNRELTKKRKQMKLLSEKRAFEISQLKQGKKPYYQKKSAQKLLELAEQFEDLKSKGSLNKHLKRHRKKKMIQDKIKMNSAL